MKLFFSKMKKATKSFFTNKSAFSLVELIVVIAIMAVMAAVLAPALLGYVERSRAQKDDSAMGEVTNAIQLSLADQNVYDELLPYAVKGNFSCYADGDASTNTDVNKTITKAPDYWLFTDEARKLDETAYFPAGSMRGATVTFKPNGSAEYILKAGVVNQIGDESTKKGTNGGAVLEDCPELYNRLRSTVGDTIKVSSQTYRNSTYTIFISMGTTGGNQADKQDAIQVYGQYNGTNLPEVMTATGAGSQDKGNAGSGNNGGSGQPSEPEQVVAGATFNDGTFLTWEDLKSTDNGSKYDYDASSVGDAYIVDGAFSSCTSLTSITIPDGVPDINTGTFYGCTSLTSITIPDSVTLIGSSAFKNCTSLTSITIPNSVVDIETHAFHDSGLENITYLGTKAQWNSMLRSSDWHQGVPATVVHCTDGDVAI